MNTITINKGVYEAVIGDATKALAYVMHGKEFTDSKHVVQPPHVASFLQNVEDPLELGQAMMSFITESRRSVKAHDTLWRRIDKTVATAEKKANDESITTKDVSEDTYDDIVANIHGMLDIPERLDNDTVLKMVAEKGALYMAVFVVNTLADGM